MRSVTKGNNTLGDVGGISDLERTKTTKRRRTISGYLFPLKPGRHEAAVSRSRDLHCNVKWEQVARGITCTHRCERRQFIVPVCHNAKFAELFLLNGHLVFSDFFGLLTDFGGGNITVVGL